MYVCTYDFMSDLFASETNQGHLKLMIYNWRKAFTIYLPAISLLSKNILLYTLIINQHQIILE